MPMVRVDGEAKRQLKIPLHLLRLARVENCVLIGVLTALGGEMATSRRPHSSADLVAASIVMALILAFGNTVNDLFDVEVDRATKPHRVIVAGLIGRAAAGVWAASLVLAAISVSLVALPPRLVFLVLAMATVAFTYSWKLKSTVLLGNACVAALAALTPIVGSLSVGSISARVASASAIVFAGVLLIEVSKAIEDREGDRALGVLTVAHRFSSRGRWFLTAGLASLYVSACAWPLAAGLVRSSPLYVLLFVPLLPFLVVLRQRELHRIGTYVRMSKVLWLVVPLGLSSLL